MFDEILQMVKEHLAGNPAIANLPTDQADAVHNEIASHIANATAQSPAEGGGIFDSLKNAIGGGGNITSAIEGSLVSSLGSKFGLSPSITGAIAGALPGLLQKFANKQQNTGN
ncbi:MAG: hypothetical protein ABI204_09745 [Ginsengibacter sp.]